MDRFKLWVCGAIAFVILMVVIVVAAVHNNSENKSGNKGQADDPNSYEHVFGELTPAGSLSQKDPATTPASGGVTIPDDGLEIIDETSLGLTSDIEYLKARTEKGFVIEIIDGITYVDGFLFVNKTYALPSDYVPEDTHVDLEGVEYSYDGMTNETWDAWQAIKAAAAEEGLSLWIGSGYRSYGCQEGLYNNYVARDGKEAADTFSARAGHSEHQSALCFDLNSVTDAFADTAEGKWVNENCWKYGLIIRYPKGKSDITGYKYESWHLRYVGTELAEKLYNNGDWITMEEYFGLSSKYAVE
ncbi:MAG: M15 family metallopeptidase [Lachnospiraceae bacterium]